MSGVRINTLNILDLVHHESRGHTRSNSMSSPLDGGVRILSRYLRPSLSSCHDFCKFGVERTLEIKARGPLAMPKGNTATLAEGLDGERTSISVDRKKKLALKLKSFPASKAQKLVFPILNGVVSPLTTEQTVFSGQVSPHVKETVLSVIRIEDQKTTPADDPKMKPAEDPKMKPLQPNQSSRRMERCSNNEGQIKVETSKEMGNLSTDSPRDSSSRRRSKEKGSLVTGERKALVPSSVSSSSKDSPKKVSSRNADNSSNVTGVSHFSNKKPVRKPQPEQPSWEDVPEKTLHVVEPNAEDKTPGVIKNVICVTDFSPPSVSSHEDKSWEHAQKGSLTAQPSTLSSMRNLRDTLSGTPATNSPSSHPPSAKQNLRHTQSGIQAANSPPSCPSSAKQKLRSTKSGIQSPNSPSSRPATAKQNLRRTRMGIQAASSPLSCRSSAKQKLRCTQSGIKSANSPSSGPPTAKQNLRRTQCGIQATNSPPFCAPSPRKKESRGTQLGIRTSSLASLTTFSSASSEPVETDSENQTSDLKKECKNGPRKGRSISSKDDNVPGKKLTFRRGKVVDLHPVYSTPTRLKFRRSVLGENQNGKGDASKETPGKKEATTAQIPPSPAKQNSTCTENITRSTQSHLSWPPSPKNEGLRGTLPGIRIACSYSSSLASTSARSETSSETGETDVENQILDLEREYKNRPRKDGPNTLKDGQSLGQKLSFRRGKVVELHPLDSTPKRLKFKKRVIGDSPNGEGDAGSKTVEKKEAIASQLSSFSAKKNSGHTQSRIQSSRLSWPPSPKKKGMRGTEFELGTTITRSYSCTSSLASLSMNGDEIDTEKQRLDLENEFKNVHEMDGTTSSKEECDPVQKLTFRRGKVVDNIHSEDSAPRRLKFKRRESLLGDSNKNDSGDAGRIILGKQEFKYVTTESKDVALKHQDVEGKNSSSLFNNVIEETVSELVKTRKSKVKALVGAFETLISLQDTRPAY